MRKLLILFLSYFLLTLSCKTPDYLIAVEDTSDLRGAFDRLSEVIIHDIFSPPVASRIYVYPSIAAYEVWAQSDSTYRSLGGQLNGLSTTPAAPFEEYSPSIAALHAFYIAAKHFIFTEERFTEFYNNIDLKWQKSGVPKSILKRSKDYGELVANHIIDYAQLDNYKQTRTNPKFSISKDPSRWKPTPPGYMDGIEPSWRDIRPLIIDSAQQFVPRPNTPFDIDENSLFYQEALDVYNVGNKLTTEEREIAAFWDCNPFKLNVVGHVMHATKKITPGGHWIGIVGVISRDGNLSMAETIEAYTLTSIALFDGFISCWDEKYRSNLVRPETYINQYIDENWVPFLQTPPFPEHTSGHSVISRAAAVALTSIFGDNYSYSDDVEVAYGLPVRHFTSFYHASDEAAVSRLYGGIHYRPAIDEGVEQGERLGNYIIGKIKLRHS